MLSGSTHVKFTMKAHGEAGHTVKAHDKSTLVLFMMRTVLYTLKIVHKFFYDMYTNHCYPPLFPQFYDSRRTVRHKCTQAIYHALQPIEIS